MVTQTKMFARASALLLLASCWTSEIKPVTEPTKPAAQPVPAVERRATVRIDAAPGGKAFQGVWLEFAADKRWVTDYRARELWKPFENREVLVTGTCYRPFGQAITATHFRVDRMRFVKPERGHALILELGPEQMMKGSFVLHQFPPGSKRADSPMVMFRDEGGTEYIIAGASGDVPAVGTAARIKTREVVPDLSIMAQTDGPNIWILDVRRPDSVEDAAHAPVDVPCP
jgi:hypothetical protein